MQNLEINRWQWQEQFGYVQARQLGRAQEVLICSGQTANDDMGNPLLRGDMPGQIARALANMEVLFSAADWSLQDIVRVRLFTTDMEAFMQHSSVITKWYARAGCRPVQTLVGVAALAFPEMMVEIEVEAVR